MSMTHLTIYLNSIQNSDETKVRTLSIEHLKAFYTQSIHKYFLNYNDS